MQASFGVGWERVKQPVTTAPGCCCLGLPHRPDEV